MPVAYSETCFRYGSKAEYDSLNSKDQNSIYFTTDTHQIFIGSDEYSATVSAISKNPTKAEKGVEGRFYINTSTGGLFAYIGGRWITVYQPAPRMAVASLSSDDEEHEFYDPEYPDYPNSLLRFNGSKLTIDDLPSEGNEHGDVYYVVKESSAYVFVEDSWEILGPIFDADSFIPKVKNSGGYIPVFKHDGTLESSGLMISDLNAENRADKAYIEDMTSYIIEEYSR